jgi:hypothetical protein
MSKHLPLLPSFVFFVCFVVQSFAFSHGRDAGFRGRGGAAPAKSRALVPA